MKHAGLAAIALAASGVLAAWQGQTAVERGDLDVFLLERHVGRESFTLTSGRDGNALEAKLDITDRGSRVQLDASLDTSADYTPRTFRASGRSYRFVNVDTEVQVGPAGNRASVRNGGESTSTDLPGPFFTARGYPPLSARGLLVKYWEQHGRPAAIRLVPGPADASIHVRFRGADTIRAGGRAIELKRYAIDGVVWGRETLWLDSDGRFAAIATRVHILPLEAVRTDLREAFPGLQARAIRDRMDDLAALGSRTAPLAQGQFALVNARIVDSIQPPIEDGVLLVRNGRIAAVGPRGAVRIPAGVRLVPLDGRTIVPGLWDMHGHVSQIEWAPAYLAAGVTTVRDMGGEREFLRALRETIARGARGPRLLLAGLVDGEAPDAFGTITAATADAARAVVDRYHADHFDQIKIYSRVAAGIVPIITARAHELGMRVAGHVPTDLSLAGAIEAGMDHIAHLSVRAQPGTAAFDALVKLMLERRTVMDPTMAWTELLGRAPATTIASFEPGIEQAPAPLRMNYESLRNDTDPSAAATRISRALAAVKALHDRGVPIVTGTDGAVPGSSVLREIELYVAAGMTPIDALRAATIVPARAMGLDGDSGSIGEGQRADLLIVDGNPLTDIRSMRRAYRVVAAGSLFDAAALRRGN